MKVGPNPVSYDSSESVVVFLDGRGLDESVYQKYDLSTLEDLLIEQIEPSGIGELDGHETGPGGTAIYLYGPNAEELFASILPVLEAYPLCRNGRVVIRRFGPVEPREVLLPRATPRG